MTTTPTATASPTIPLAPGERACAGCGVAVPANLAQEVLRPATPYGWQRIDLGHRALYVEFTRCPDCAATRRRAEHLLAAHPRILGRYGNVAPDRLEAALGALAILSASTPPISSARDLVALIEHLTLAGGSAQFLRRYASTPGVAARTRWAHLDAEDHAALREGYGALLRERTLAGQTRPVPSPATPCGYCGVETVRVPALGDTQPWRVWRQVTCNPATLGGRFGREITTMLCPPCSRASEREGSIGPSAMSRALLAYLGEPRESEDPIEGLRGWAATGRTEANPTPWSHIPNIAELRTVG